MAASPHAATVPLRTAADLLGIGHSTAYDLAKTGQLCDGVPVLHVGRRRVVSKRHLEDALGGGLFPPREPVAVLTLEDDGP